MSLIAPSELRLVIQGGPLQGATLPLPTERLVIGRDPACDLRLDDPKVSRIHGILEVVDSVVMYRDNGSTNGSRLNGRLIEQERLKPGDLLQIGLSEIALLQVSDFQSIQFNHQDGGSQVTRSVRMDSVSADALADKLSEIFDYYRNHPPEVSPHEIVDLVRTQRLAQSLRALFSVVAGMSRLLPEEALLQVIGNGLFEVFAGAENIIILLYDAEHDEFVPRYARDRHGNSDVSVSVSMTVLERAAADRATLVANDAPSDDRLNTSTSIADYAVKTVLCAPLVVADEVFGALYLDNREHPIHYDEMDIEVATAFANQAAIALSNCRLCDNLQQSYHQMLQSLVKAIEAKDPYTVGHTQRVKQYSLGIGEELGFATAHLRRLSMAADLHDIGKIGIREGIINKVGDLTETEYQNIRNHVEVGERILQPITYLRDILPWIRGHHERWDGKGYPDALAGEAIPLEARILAVADAFDAMTSQRSYNKPLSFPQALERIARGAGSHFDPGVVDAFHRYMHKATISSARPEPSWLDVPPTSPQWRPVTSSIDSSLFEDR